MGDGMLAIFPFRDGASAAGAAARALVAARASLDWARALDADPAFADARPLRAVAALHAGDVFHGNIGAPGRLDFTAIGPGLNLVSRLEALAKALGRDLVLSADFAALCGGRFESLGHHALRGVATPVEAFACAPEE
jgi:adenylate cyclase